MTTTSILILETAIQQNEITMSVYERGSTVHQYEKLSISLEEVRILCDEIIKLLNKSNEQRGSSSGIHIELQKSGQLLYDQLLTENIKRKLKASDNNNLLLYIDENLVSIPWELLFDGKQFLCLRFNMGRSVKTRQALRDAGPRSLEFPIKMLILADPTNDLKSARQEASAIEKQLDNLRKVINVGKKVTNIDTVYVKKNLRDYDIVHYAGHTDYDVADPAKSSWSLFESRLTAADILNMGATSPLPSLVFSNSCQSAHTKEWAGNNLEEKVFGLANAFLCSGVRHYIGTLWKIPDEDSLAFAKEFYAQIAQEKSVGEAIRQARLKMMTDLGEDSIVWASYVLYGDPTNALIGMQSKRPPVGFVYKNWQKIIIGAGIIAGICGFLWLVYFFNLFGMGGDRKALFDYYYQRGVAFYKNGKIVDSEASLIKARKICSMLQNCPKDDVEDSWEELQAMKMLDVSAREQNFDMRVRATMELARIENRRFFRIGHGEQGDGAEEAKQKAIDTYRTVVRVIEDSKNITQQNKEALAEATFSLVMLYISDDRERAEYYYNKFFGYSSEEHRFDYLKRINDRIDGFMKQDKSGVFYNTWSSFGIKVSVDMAKQIKPMLLKALKSIDSMKAFDEKEAEKVQEIKNTGNNSTSPR
ncbi:MAG: CHAT domain-containing protein [Candidatus Omnitrophica bacterium]|nr:CHAT domain-containing protein [Candidatus Omnitrophota bacterium]